MNNTLREAARLLNEYKPKEALQKLSQLNDKSEKSLQLEKKCKKLLSQQILFHLKELDVSKDNIAFKKHINDYRKFIGEDKSITPYIKLMKEYEIEQEKDMNTNVYIGIFSLIGIAIIIILSCI